MGQNALWTKTISFRNRPGRIIATARRECPIDDASEESQHYKSEHAAVRSNAPARQPLRSLTRENRGFEGEECELAEKPEAI